LYRQSKHTFYVQNFSFLGNRSLYETVKKT